jgi:thiol-disulfide isomerase/thioredoxin
VRRLGVPALTLALVLAACGGVGQDSGSGSGTRPLLPADRLALPEYGLAQFEELLGELRGRPAVVNFWGSWCPPCRQEAPDLRTASEEFDGRVQFLGVDILDNRQAAREFIREFDWGYPSVFDPEAEIRDGLGYVGQPITLIYDARGRLAFDIVGTVTLELLREEIRGVL